MRKANALLSMGILVLFLIHAVLGRFQLSGILPGGSRILMILAWLMTVLIVVHTVLGCIMTVQTLSAQKEDGCWMHCHTAENTVCISAVGMTLLMLGVFLLRNRKGAFALSLLTTVAAALTALLPNTIIHMCMMTNMHCHAVMKPTVILLSVIIAVISLITGIMRLREKE